MKNLLNQVDKKNQKKFMHYLKKKFVIVRLIY